jgi:phosphoglucosamine mutase
MTRLFGTDGVRGVANRDLTPDLALALGRAAGFVLGPRGGEVVVGRDTRVSGPMLEAALVAGLCSSGVHSLLAGVMPTPAVAFLTLDAKARAGAMISASHNPVGDNGIKFFSDEGVKISGELEERIESAMVSEPPGLPTGTDVGTAYPFDGALDVYIDHLLSAIEAPLSGLKIVLDCAHGAAWQAGPRVFREAGADVVGLHTEPDGARINVECGSTSPEELGRRVVAEGADMGLAFDGDADRVLAVDERGHVVDGDRIIAMAAFRMHAAGELKNDLVIATVMANLGFHRALKDRGIGVFAAPVGDRYVAEAMKERGAMLGGEQSGHIIFAAHSTTGDGILTGLKVAEMVHDSDQPLSLSSSVFDTYPQELVNVPVSRKEALDSAEGLWSAVRAAEASLGDRGRVLVRASGTEPLVRVMVEAEDADTASTTAAALADAVREELG